MRDIRIATVILPASIGQLQANLDRMSHWIEVAKDQGAEIVCFPEMNLSGYAPTAMTTKAALSIPGPVTDRLLQKARDNDLVILAGLAEKTADRKLFATHLALCPDGRLESYLKFTSHPRKKKYLPPAIASPCLKARGLWSASNFATMRTSLN